MTWRGLLTEAKVWSYPDLWTESGMNRKMLRDAKSFLSFVHPARAFVWLD